MDTEWVKNNLRKLEIPDPLKDIYKVYGPIYPLFTTFINIIYFPIAITNPIYMIYKSSTDKQSIPHRNKIAASTIPFFGIIIAEYGERKITWAASTIFMIAMIMQITTRFG